MSNPLPMLCEGTYDMILRAVDPLSGQRLLRRKLSFEGTEPVEHVLPAPTLHAASIASIVPKVNVYIYGTADAAIAWRRRIGQTFKVSAEHRQDTDGKYTLLELRVVS